MKIQFYAGAIYASRLMLPLLSVFLIFLLFPPLLLFLPIAFLLVLPGSGLRFFIGPRFVASPLIHPLVPRSPPV